MNTHKTSFDKNKSELSRETIKDFFEKFDTSDPHIKVVLEILLEELYENCEKHAKIANRKK